MISTLPAMRWLASLRRIATEGPPSARVYRAAIALILLLGVALRLNGQITNPPSFWLDEAFWGERLFERSVLDHKFRPVGFMWLSKLLVTWFGASEFWLRFVPNLSSIIALLLMPYVASRLLKGRMARLLLLLSFALLPALIDLSKEFKPYSFEVLVHLVPVVLYLRYRETQRPSYFYALLIALPLLFPFAYNIAFSYPGILLLCLWQGWQRWRYRGAVAVVGSGVVCLAVVGGIYATLLRGVTSDRHEAYWGKKYDVFYKQKPAAGDDREDDDDEPRQLVGEEKRTRLEWLVDKYDDIAAVPGLRRELWQVPKAFPGWFGKELGSAERLLWLGLHFLALYYLVSRRNFELLGLLVAPLACALLLNTLGKWPIGAFRTNLFLCAYAIIIPAIAADILTANDRVRSWVLGGVFALLTFVPGFAFGFDWHREKHIWTRNHQERLLLATLRRHRESHLQADPTRPPERLMMDPHTFESHDFYLKYHPQAKAENGDFFKNNFAVDRLWRFPTKIRSQLKKRFANDDHPVWVVVSKGKDMPKVKSEVTREATILSEEHIGTDHMILLVGRK